MIRDLAKIVQRRLQTFYGLEQAPCVGDFVTLAAPGERERLLFRQHAEDQVELRLVLPEFPLSEALQPSRLSDRYLQLLEGVSHFVLLAERIRVGCPTSQLELELQAEVDKLVLIQNCLGDATPHDSERLHHKLYERVSFLHPAGSEPGDRYRLANRVAARFTKRLPKPGSPARLDLLRRFYRAGLNGKMHLSQAA